LVFKKKVLSWLTLKFFEFSDYFVNSEKWVGGSKEQSWATEAMKRYSNEVIR
jgi:hypothetical protein